MFRWDNPEMVHIFVLEKRSFLFTLYHFIQIVVLNVFIKSGLFIYFQSNSSDLAHVDSGKKKEINAQNRKE